MGKIILFNKPFNVLSQFTDNSIEQEKRQTLSHFINQKGFYTLGRLDRDSEGLLVLTNDGEIQSRISHPQFKIEKKYWIQVEGEPNEVCLNLIRNGITLKDGICRPAHIKIITEPSGLWNRTPPIRFRKTVKDKWLEITLTEGRNRQIRRMTAAIGHPTLRLIRHSVGPWTIKGLKNGKCSKVHDFMLSEITAHLTGQS